MGVWLILWNVEQQQQLTVLRYVRSKTNDAGSCQMAEK